MTQLTEQLSAVRNTQLEAQLDVFRSLSTRALDSAGKLFALNMKTSRQSIDQAAGTFRQLLDARDPRDLLAVGKAAQDQWQNLFSYGREVFGIATGAPALNWIGARSPAPAPASASAPVPAPALEVPATYAKGLEQAAIVTATEAAVEAAVETAIADDMPPATPTPVARVLQEIAPLPASAEHPIAAPVYLDAGAEVELPQVDPVDHAPPLQVTSGPTPKPMRAPRKK
jgi:phasin family protein